ncbi:hypothetical protein [Zobellia nedashkovskayae]|uniref:hypothetical protein n=1 Tax=Zobellia nedashkovskayae TaxID=2779510 RepID=UPI00188A134C|nr:hypothetical protein [Zobellia nedashkovskayae]
MLNFSSYTKRLLTTQEIGRKLNSYQRKSATSEFLNYWNYSISPDTEKFWAIIKDNGITIERKDPFRFALDKNRFIRVELGIGARKYWTKLKTLKEITKRFSETEISKIGEIITEDENKRIGILKKCLAKKNIPKSQYLKFGECMAYFANTGLFSKYMDENEVQELYRIWKNFKS